MKNLRVSLVAASALFVAAGLMAKNIDREAQAITDAVVSDLKNNGKLSGFRDHDIAYFETQVDAVSKNELNLSEGAAQPVGIADLIAKVKSAAQDMAQQAVKTATTASQSAQDFVTAKGMPYIIAEAHKANMDVDTMVGLIMEHGGAKVVHAIDNYGVDAVKKLKEQGSK